ncbi:MAG: hypothetical protein LUQ19_04125 [Methanoregula sp.]|nr:hypothetical protein [Methanoregula sp.]
MNFPLSFTMLVSAGAGADGNGYEVYLNRSGINTIDTPREKILAEPGTGLVLKLLNRGAPIHITVTSSNAGMFTDFFHENMYIVDEAVLSIPIRKDCMEGTFNLEIIAGYGAVKTSLPVTVLSAQHLRPKVQEEYPLQPVAHGRPHLLMVTMGIGLILYCAWLYTEIAFLNIVSFIVLIVGALYTWYRQR